MVNFIKEFLDSVIVFDTEFTKTRIGSQNDGGYIVLDEISKDIKQVISMGVGNDIEFELDIVRRYGNDKVIKFIDPTIDGLPPKIRDITEDNLIFFYKDSALDYLRKIKVIGNDRSLLKVDIEWNEWDFIQEIREEDLLRFDQILIEFHLIHSEPPKNLTNYFTSVYEDVFLKINQQLFQKYLSCLRKLLKNFYIFHIHANNSLPLSYCWFEFPPLLELSFVRKDLCNNILPFKGEFPIKGLDNPNKTDRPDLLNYYSCKKGFNNELR